MSKKHPLFLPVVFVGGLLFGAGLAYSQMAKPEVVLDFLQFDDFGLLLVMGAAVVITAITFTLGVKSRRKAPLTGTVYGYRTDDISGDLIAGGVIFGIGWGLSGICPGAAYASIGLGNLPILIGIAGMLIGTYLLGLWKSSSSK